MRSFLFVVIFSACCQTLLVAQNTGIKPQGLAVRGVAIQYDHGPVLNPMAGVNQTLVWTVAPAAGEHGVKATVAQGAHTPQDIAHPGGRITHTAIAHQFDDQVLVAGAGVWAWGTQYIGWGAIGVGGEVFADEQLAENPGDFGESEGGIDYSDSKSYKTDLTSSELVVCVRHDVKIRAGDFEDIYGEEYLSSHVWHQLYDFTKSSYDTVLVDDFPQSLQFSFHAFLSTYKVLDKNNPQHLKYLGVSGGEVLYAQVRAQLVVKYQPMGPGGATITEVYDQSDPVHVGAQFPSGVPN